MRNPRYKISFAYVFPNTDKIVYGKLDEKIFTFEEVDFIFKMLSPMKSIELISSIRNLRKGGLLNFTFDETINGNVMKKVIRVSRN